MTALSPATRKVVVTQHFFDEAATRYLRDHDCEVRIADLPSRRADSEVPREVLVEWLQGAAGWIVGHAHVTRDLLLALPELKIVSRRGVGYERVDTNAVRDLGRVATIAAGGNDATVAEQTIGLMLALGRRFREGQASINRGSFAIPMGADLFGKTIGVIGLGRIGRALVKRLVAFECRVLVHTPRRDAELAARAGFEYADLDTLLSQSDFVTLHAPLRPETRFIIREQTIRLMKPTAFVINTARGGLVEDRDLLLALENKQLAGAGLDVFVSESDPSYHHVTHELASLPNVIALPHAGASTREGLGRTNMIAARCVVAVLNGTSPPAECVIADGRVRHR